MATYTVTAANVDPNAAVGSPVIAGEAIDAGEWVYIKAADGKAWLATNATQAEAKVAGMAVNSAVAGQPICYVASGAVEVGSIGAEGQPVALKTAGQMMDSGDLASDEWVTLLGWFDSSTSVTIAIQQTDEQFP